MKENRESRLGLIKFFGFLSILAGFFQTPLYPSHIYLAPYPNSLEKDRYFSCIGKPLEPFQFEEKDFEKRSIPQTLRKMKARAQQEGSARSKSIICLLTVFPLPSHERELQNWVRNFFSLENELFLVYSQYLDSVLWLDRSQNPSFLKSRQDLMRIVQNKTQERIFQNTPPDPKEMEEEFSKLYESILRIHFDFLLAIGAESRKIVFQSREAKP